MAVKILNKNVSRLVKAFEGFKEGLKPYSDQPKGMFGRVTIVKTGAVTINSDELDVDIECPFDDDTEANEIEIKVYNLSKATIQALKWNNPISVTAGYKGDTGVIFSGYISKVSTKWDGMDKVTTINALDNFDLKEHDIAEKAYKQGTKASYILKDLISLLKLPIGEIKIRRDWTYKEETNVTGGLMDNIKKYAEVCGISVYINKGKIYARHITDGDNIEFTVSEETGMIGSPEEFEEEITAEDYKDTVNGYKIKMILQHRMTTAAIVNLKSQFVSGQFRVRSGKHTINESESITEIEVIKNG